METLIQLSTGPVAALAAGNALAAIIVPNDGKLIASDLTIYGDPPTGSTGILSGQIGFGSTLAIENDSRQMIYNFGVGIPAIDTIQAQGYLTQRFDWYDGLPVEAGEKIFMHIGQIAQFGNGQIIHVLHFVFAGTGARRRGGVR